MKTIIMILLFVMSVTGYSQSSKKLADENKELKAKILLYEMLVIEQDKAIKTLEEMVSLMKKDITPLNPKPTIKPVKDGKYYLNYYKREALFDRDVYIKGNIWLIRECDTILVNPR